MSWLRKTKAEGQPHHHTDISEEEVDLPKRQWREGPEYDPSSWHSVSNPCETNFILSSPFILKIGNQVTPSSTRMTDHKHKPRKPPPQRQLMAWNHEKSWDGFNGQSQPLSRGLCSDSCYCISFSPCCITKKLQPHRPSNQSPHLWRL